MKVTRVCGTIALALVLQTTLARFVIGGGFRVDLILIAVVYLALTAGPVTGLWVGSVGGIAQDLLSGGIVGVSGLAKTIVGFLVGVMGTQFIVVELLHGFLFFLVANLAHSVCFHGLYVMLDSGGTVPPLSAMLGEMLINSVVGVMLMQLITLGPDVMARYRIKRANMVRRRLGDRN